MTRASARALLVCRILSLSLSLLREKSLRDGIELMSMSLCVREVFLQLCCGCVRLGCFSMRGLSSFSFSFSSSRFDAFKPCRRFRIDGFSFRSTLTGGEWKKEEDARSSTLLNLTPRATIERR